MRTLGPRLPVPLKLRCRSFGPTIAALLALVLGAGPHGASAQTECRNQDGTVSDKVEEPTFVPYTMAPTLIDREATATRLAEMYPKEAVTPERVTVMVQLGLSAHGVVEKVCLVETSGQPAFDEAALAFALTLRFRPAMDRNRRVPVWMNFPVTFRPPSGAHLLRSR